MIRSEYIEKIRPTPAFIINGLIGLTNFSVFKCISSQYSTAHYQMNCLRVTFCLFVNSPVYFLLTLVSHQSKTYVFRLICDAYQEQVSFESSHTRAETGADEQRARVRSAFHSSLTSYFQFLTH